jgi:hypothetical protein
MLITGASADTLFTGLQDVWEKVLGVTARRQCSTLQLFAVVACTNLFCFSEMQHSRLLFPTKRKMNLDKAE